MVKEYKYKGETFTLDDSKGCYIKVTYAEHPQFVGYVGVNISKTVAKPFAVSHDGYEVTPDGIPVPRQSGYDINELIVECCRHLIERKKTADLIGDRGKEALCNDLHQWYADLKPGA